MQGAPSRGLSLTNIAIVGGIAVASVMLWAAFSPGFRMFLATGKWTAPPAA